MRAATDTTSVPAAGRDPRDYGGATRDDWEESTAFDRKYNVRDIAGGVVISDEVGLQRGKASINDPGEAQKVVVRPIKAIASGAEGSD